MIDEQTKQYVLENMSVEELEQAAAEKRRARGEEYARMGYLTEDLYDWDINGNGWRPTAEGEYEELYDDWPLLTKEDRDDFLNNAATFVMPLGVKKGKLFVSVRYPNSELEQGYEELWHTARVLDTGKISCSNTLWDMSQAWADRFLENIQEYNEDVARKYLQTEDTE